MLHNNQAAADQSQIQNKGKFPPQIKSNAIATDSQFKTDHMQNSILYEWHGLTFPNTQISSAFASGLCVYAYESESDNFKSIFLHTVR